jgi:DNA-binding transcriptional ArsR family regulator
VNARDRLERQRVAELEQIRQTEGVAAKKKGRGKTQTRFQTINLFLDETARDLNRTAALAWVCLWRDERNGRTSASLADMAARMGSSRRAVTYALQELQAAGLVKLVRRGSPSGGPNVYRIRPVPYRGWVVQ